jgi:signal transduction histidine kinase
MIFGGKTAPEQCWIFWILRRYQINSGPHAPAAPPTELLSAVADYLCAFRERLTEEWAQAVREDARIPSSDDLTFPQLADHMPALFDDLANRLREANVSRPVPQASEDARAHGHHRWSQGYDVTQLLREIATARRTLLFSAVADFARQHSELTGEAKTLAKRVIHEFFNNLVVNSVAQYVSDQKAEMRRINDELANASCRLQDTNENLQRADESRLLLTRNVSHEIRNIANAITGAVTVLAGEGEDRCTTR